MHVYIAYSAAHTVELVYTRPSRVVSTAVVVVPGLGALRLILMQSERYNIILGEKLPPVLCTRPLC